MITTTTTCDQCGATITGRPKRIIDEHRPFQLCSHKCKAAKFEALAGEATKAQADADAVAAQAAAAPAKPAPSTPSPTA